MEIHLSEELLRQRVKNPYALDGPQNTHFLLCDECKGRYEGFKEEEGAGAAKAVAIGATRGRYERQKMAKRGEGRLWRWPAWAVALAGVAVVAILITGVAATSGLLWQPSKVHAVNVSTADMQALSQLKDYGDWSWTQKPEVQVGLSAEQAASVSNLSVPQVNSLPSGVSSHVTYAASGKGSATFTFSAAKAEAVAKASGKTLPALPTGMDGASLNISLGGGIAEIYGEMGSGTTMAMPEMIVAESSVPIVSSEKVSVSQMEDYILSLPGVSSELAGAIKGLQDPSTTLLVPVPLEYADGQDVSVNGASGVLVGDNTGVGAGVIWIKDGQVYVVAGGLKQADVLSVAKGLS